MDSSIDYKLTFKKGKKEACTYLYENVTGKQRP